MAKMIQPSYAGRSGGVTCVKMEWYSGTIMSKQTKTTIVVTEAKFGIHVCFCIKSSLNDDISDTHTMIMLTKQQYTSGLIGADFCELYEQKLKCEQKNNRVEPARHRLTDDKVSFRLSENIQLAHICYFISVIAIDNNYFTIVATNTIV